MIRICCVIVIYLFLDIPLLANNIRVKNLQWDPNSVNSQDILTMTFTVMWQNSWRDSYNYDAAYVFFKFRHVDAENQPWHHLYLQDEGNKIGLGEAESEDYECWVSPLSVTGQNLNTGIYIFRKEDGSGDNSVDVTVKWNIKKQIGVSLNGSDFADHKILVSAFAVEMVYIPRGPFRIGDGMSDKSFRKALSPIPEAYDLISDTLSFLASAGNPKLAANRANDNTANTLNAWVGTADNGGKNESYWIVDFGEGNEKKVTYFGVTGAAYQPTYYPRTFALEGATTPGGPWNVVWSGEGKGNWNVNANAYPVEKAIKVTTPDNWRCYRLRVESMNAGYPIVKSIAMTDRELDTIWDHTVVVDGPTLQKDTLYYLGARDGSAWTGTLPETFPNGYKGFYAMKYEISQEQYVRFLNKLSYTQQNGLLDGRLERIDEGSYVFGDDKLVDHRNGIMLSSEVEGKAAVFSNNYTPGDDPGKEADGQNIACNYMSVNDMLAYADWAGLRPLTEMEYEKMARPLYPYRPKKGEFAWNSTRIDRAETLNAPGAPSERTMTGNANFNNEETIGGPLRSGSFATDISDRENAGAGYWGCQELSGNLAEMYYNVNNQGLQVVAPSGSGTALSGHRTSHGDGYLSADGHHSLTNNSWAAGPQYIALRGGSYASKDSSELAVSNRTYHMNALKSVTERLPDVTFRLGRSVPEQPELMSVLTLENEQSTAGYKHAEDMEIEKGTDYYTILGNYPEGLQGNAYSYIWYMKEYGDKDWHILEGENNKDLVFDHFREDSVNTQIYSFKRTVCTPFRDSRTSSAYKVDLIVKGKIILLLSREAVEIGGNQYVTPQIKAMTLLDAKFKWEYSNRVLPEISSGNNFSVIQPNRRFFSFNGSAGNYTIRLTVTHMDESVETVNIPVKVAAEATTYNSQNVPCGSMMKDTRDNNIYATVQIGNQCWMAENLRYAGYGSYTGMGTDRKVLGSLYTWRNANANNISSGSKQGACPAGWRLPTRAEWQTLINAVGGDSRKLKAPDWTTVQGNNASGFAALPIGWHDPVNGWVYSTYRAEATRYWTSELTCSGSKCEGYYVVIWDDNNNISLTWSGSYRGWDDPGTGNNFGAVRCVK